MAADANGSKRGSDDRGEMDVSMDAMSALVVECTKVTFTAGVIGNLAASGIQWASSTAQSKLSKMVSTSVDSGLSNHSLARALLRAHFEATRDTIDVTLLEDYSADRTQTRNWLRSLRQLRPAKAISDAKEPDIACLWLLRDEVHQSIAELGSLTVTELDKALLVDVTHAHEAAASQMSEGLDQASSHWSRLASQSMCLVLEKAAAPAHLPDGLRARVEDGFWIDLFRIAFREALKNDHNAETMYFVHVNEMLAQYAKDHSLNLLELKAQVADGFEKSVSRLTAVRQELSFLRQQLVSLETASVQERKKIEATLRAHQAQWRNIADQYGLILDNAHRLRRTVIKGQEKLVKRVDASTRHIDKQLTQLGEAINAGRTADNLRVFVGATSLLQRLRRGFWGREWLFESISQFRASNRSTGGYVVITGLPGQGKSAIAAHLADAPNTLLHFFRRDTGDSALGSFQTHLADQACERFGVTEDVKRRHKQPEEFLSTLLWELSSNAGSHADIVVIVDGLDEAAPEALRAGRNPLGLPARLGRGVFVVITSRERTDCRLAHVDAATPILEIRLHKEAASNEDASGFIRQQLEHPDVSKYVERNGISRDAFVKMLTAKSEGNFMYLRHVLPELARGILVGTQLQHFPKGLAEFYELHWVEMRKDAQGADIGLRMAVLAVLGALKEPCPPSDLQEIIKCFAAAPNVDGVQVVLDRRMLSASNEELRTLLDEWDEFLLSETHLDQETEYRIYHLEFGEFVCRKAREEKCDLYDRAKTAYFAWLESISG